MDPRIQMVIAIMKNDLNRGVSVEDIARSVNLSSSRLRHLFKGETGNSPAHYLKTLRILEAKELLETTFLNMKQIMSKIGVHDKGQFAKDFKKIYGVNPAQYRHRHNSELKSLRAAKSSTK